ncbi:unnamed protein product [Polarella glacialis]|uniref:Uncharacterized protein n=1 Tax=Polarella glacialis TaxID=89957 RepID=A0A813HIU1_POLGL|nr:unnamed protein product [Polarella glacialis]
MVLQLLQRRALAGLGHLRPAQGVAFRSAPLALAAEARRGMKYNLFPRLDFLAYLKRIHVAYHPGRERTEVARRLIMHMTSESAMRKFPNLKSSWELLGYDAPATVDVELVDGKKKRFLAEHYSQREMQETVITVVCCCCCLCSVFFWMGE